MKDHCHGVVWLFLCLLLVALAGRAQASSGPDSRDQAAAVALNYCRASFHRIRKYQSKRVLVEEEENILNNLDLSMIDDEEVIQLYSAVLDEISQIQISEQEKKYFKDQFRRTLQRRLTVSAFLLAGQLATGQFVGALRTGVNSWWDYRDLGLRRDLDVWRVERQRLATVMSKSSQFLDTFWKMVKKRNIPDRWLVRGDDLDRLEETLREPDPAVRLRILERMKRFMECYPPYWYHLARTQQALGHLQAAAATYERLADLGAGHFRKDDMLAAAMANLAMIQEYLEQPKAVETAREALRYSTDVWEANLMSAFILQRHGFFEEAEDAILRNLDVKLEQDQSRIALLALYLQWKNKEKLLEMLSQKDVLPRVPVVYLIRCAELLGDELPDSVREYLRMSLYGYLDLHFGADDFVIQAAPSWQLNNARLSLLLGSRQVTAARGKWTGEQWEVRFFNVGEFGSDFKPQWNLLRQVTLILNFPGQPTLRVELARPVLSAAVKQRASGWASFTVRTSYHSIPYYALQVVGVALGEHWIQLTEPVRRPNASPAPSEDRLKKRNAPAEPSPYYNGSGANVAPWPQETTPRVPVPSSRPAVPTPNTFSGPTPSSNKPSQAQPVAPPPPPPPAQPKQQTSPQPSTETSSSSGRPDHATPPTASGAASAHSPNTQKQQPSNQLRSSKKSSSVPSANSKEKEKRLHTTNRPVRSVPSQKESSQASRQSFERGSRFVEPRPSAAHVAKQLTNSASSVPQTSGSGRTSLVPPAPSMKPDSADVLPRF